MKNNIIDVKRTPSTPVPELITVAEAKAQAIVTYSDDDTLFASLIQKAIKAIENYCNISINPYSVILTADLYNEWELPYGPVTGINAVQTRTALEGSGPPTYSTQQTGWSQDGQQFVTFIPAPAGGFLGGGPFRGYFQWGPYASGYGGGSWENRYRITYTTGYGVTMPDDLKQACLVQCAWLYEHRGEESISVCEAARILADPFKRTLWQ